MLTRRSCSSNPSRGRWSWPPTVDSVDAGSGRQQPADHTSPQLLALLDRIRIRPAGSGAPRKRPDMLIADKGYAHDSTRRVLRQRGIRHTIPERCPIRAPAVQPRAAGAATTIVRQGALHRRNVVERCFNRFKQWRDLATRFAKRADRSTTPAWS
ncbi:transposase [Dactylosporangium sp. CA-139066]|uniref:transposase n=1 Tax=Dactylosporangium sp. CA-139066 TaxID=3239930 RepID=UPI003D8A1A7C